LLAQIAAAIHKPSLESILQGLPGARVEGDEVVLDLAQTNDFYRKKIAEELPLISEAASRVLGRTVKVRCGQAASAPGKPAAAPAASKSGVLEQAMQEPVVRSFLDAFPGPVKAEELDQ
jgi:hypothetical protein